MIDRNANADIKKMLRENTFYYWQIALEIGVSENTIVRWLRTELSTEKKQLIENAVDRLLTERNSENN